MSWGVQQLAAEKAALPHCSRGRGGGPGTQEATEREPPVHPPSQYDTHARTWSVEKEKRVTAAATDAPSLPPPPPGPGEGACDPPKVPAATAAARMP